MLAAASSILGGVALDYLLQKVGGDIATKLCLLAAPDKELFWREWLVSKAYSAAN